MTHTRWWWVRHAPVTETGGRVYGATDPNAGTGDGAAFRALDAMLPGRAQWVTSHLRRTGQTAAAIAAAGRRRIEPLREAALGEQDFGDWHGMAYDDIRALPVAHRFWLAPAAYRVPGGESFADLCRRAGAAIRRLTRRFAGCDIVCVAHGGTIRAALGVALDLEPERALRFSAANLSLTRIDHFDDADGESWHVVCANRQPIAPPGAGDSVAR